jgi:glycogen debranching enzyme
MTNYKVITHFKILNSNFAESFEKYFWIPETSSEDANYHIQTQFINRRGIYKDIVGSSQTWPDFQLRPNLCVAMAVAPELFDKSHAITALRTVQTALLGPLGMRTLDPSDWKYSPNYDMSNDSDDFEHAKGFNYHQGPEWVWCFGYFLRAKITFPEETDVKELAHNVSRMLVNHKKHISESVWRGLTELTNKDGSVCAYSCPTQAWSSSTILDALHDLSVKL